MAFRQVDPVPKLVQLSLRIDSASHPELARWVWELPWGKRNAALIEALARGASPDRAHEIEGAHDLHPSANLPPRLASAPEQVSTLDAAAPEAVSTIFSQFD